MPWYDNIAEFALERRCILKVCTCQGYFRTTCDWTFERGSTEEIGRFVPIKFDCIICILLVIECDLYIRLVVVERFRSNASDRG